MSVEASHWALHVPVGGNEKIVLLGLANHAHPDGSESYPALNTLAAYAHCDRSTVRRNLAKLIAAGWVIEDGLGPKGQGKYRLAMTPILVGDGKTPPVASHPRGDGKTHPGGMAPVQPEPSIEPPTNHPEGGERASASDGVPAGFPEELRPHARHVMAVLKDLAERHGSRAVSSMALGNVIMARPRHPLVRAAHDFAAWADGKGQKRKDVVSGYRNWLDKCDELASLESLPGEGHAAERPAGVTPLRPNATSEERRADRQQRRIALARGDSSAVPSLPYPVEGGA